MLTSVWHLLYSTFLIVRVSADITNLIRFEIKLAISAAVGDTRGFYYGYQDSQGRSFSDAVGYRDVDKKIKAEATDQIPMGSLVKSYVATAIMRLVDQGKLDIEDTIVKHVNPWLLKYMNLSLSEVFPGPNIQEVTIRELIHMSSGISDYNDNYVWALSVYTPYDLTPYLYLTQPNIYKPYWMFLPGDGLAYSSINFLLAGIVLASIVDKPWQEVVASDFFSEEFMAASTGFKMTGEGPCSQYEYVPHTYNFNRTLYNFSNPSDPFPSPESRRSYFIDMYQHSCLNGWMFGNIITSAWDSAYYIFSVYSPNASTPLVSSASLKQITKYERATAGWGLDQNLTYGLGSMQIDLQGFFKMKTATPQEYRYWIGHAGQDYGSGGLSFYIPAFDGALNIMWNSDAGSFKEYITQSYVTCKIVEIVVNSLKPSDGPEATCGSSIEEYKSLGLRGIFAFGDIF